MDGGGLPVKMKAGPVIGEQPGGQSPVPGGLGVPDRLQRVPVAGEPPGGGPVQPGDLAGRGAPQLQLQEGGEHLVVAEPRPPRVQRHHERVRLFQVLQDSLPAPVSGQQVGQFPVDPLQDGGAQQQPPHRFGLPVQHLGQQVLGHRPLTAGEPGREPARVLVPGQRQRRQPQARRPALRLLMQQHQRRLRQLYSRSREQFPGLGQAEPQIGRADLGQLAFQPQPVQAQPHIVAGGQHEPQLRRRPHHQQLQLPQRLGAELVHIIDHQPQPVRQRRQVLQEPLHDCPPVQVRRRRQLPHQPRTRARRAQRAQHRQPEPLRIPLIPPRRHPPSPACQARLADPRPQQHRLAAARRRRHHGHPRGSAEPPKQPRTGHHAARTRTSRPSGSSARSVHTHIIPQPVKHAHYTRRTRRADPVIALMGFR